MRTAWPAAIALGLVLVGGLAIQQLGSQAPPPERSVRARGAEGRRAASALLAELELAGASWTAPPGELPRGAEPTGLLWMPRPLPPSERVRSPRAAADGLDGVHDRLGYLRFVEAGGTLVVPVTAETEAFLVEGLGLADLEGLIVGLPASTARVRTRATVATLATLATVATVATLATRATRATRASGESLTLDWPEGEVFAELDPGGPAVPVLVDETGRVLVLEWPVGRGLVALLGSDHFLSSAAIGDADHGVLFVRLVEEWARGRRVWFDEYALGGWRPPSLASLLLGPRLGWLVAHLVFLLILAACRSAWVGRFPRDPDAIELTAPLARARAGASLLERAGRWQLLAERLVRGVVGRLAIQLHASAGESHPTTGEELALVLEHAGIGDRERRWSRELDPSRVHDAEGLEDLGRSVRALERRVHERTRGRRRSAPLG